jgi:hypothetical protein
MGLDNSYSSFGIIFDERSRKRCIFGESAGCNERNRQRESFAGENRQEFREDCVNQTFSPLTDYISTVPYTEWYTSEQFVFRSLRVFFASLRQRGM